MSSFKHEQNIIKFNFNLCSESTTIWWEAFETMKNRHLEQKLRVIFSRDTNSFDFILNKYRLISQIVCFQMFRKN